MIDHFGINVSNLSKSKAFYEKALAPLGYRVAADFEWGCSFYKEGEENPAGDFRLLQDKIGYNHFAFRADNRQAVDAFYQAAIEASGVDNCGPGIREDYHENYYAAFIYDPDGYNVEAVCHKGE